jgi:hypothetical protein
MEVQVTAINIAKTFRRKGEMEPIYSGTITVAMNSPQNRAMTLEMPFENAPGLHYAIVAALTHLGQYGVAIQEAAQSALSQHKSR